MEYADYCLWIVPVYIRTISEVVAADIVCGTAELVVMWLSGDIIKHQWQTR